MEQKRPIPTERLRTIRGQMVERFSLDELRSLTFDLGTDWDRLPGDTKDVKTTALLERLNRQSQLPALLIQLQTLRPDDAWALDDLDESAESPYKGLEFYDEADSGLFFGRKRLIATLLGALRGQSFLAVVGASGSGKSSVVRAGVVPVLKGLRPPPDGAALPRDSAGWAYLEMTPTDRPLEQLALTLTRDLDTAGETLAIIRDLRESPASAHLYIRKYLERQRKPRAFLLVDQFEELFTTCKDEAERAAFTDGLLAAAEGGATTVVLTLRADFYHHCLRFPSLRDALQQRQQLIGAMDEAELREAIEQPALRTGYELEPGLADKIVRDAGDEAGALPLLSHALLETWKRREGRRLTHYGYSEAGGVGGAIARTAERAYGDLDPARQAIARRIFLQLTELGEGAEDTRRRVALADLLPGDAAVRSEAEAVLTVLSQARLVSADDAAAQVSHEALIREWPALQEWLRDNREALRLERRLAAAAAEWDEGERDSSYLYDGAQLAAAGAWAAANPTSVTGTVRAFLDAATVEEEREAAEREAARRQRERLIRRAFVGVSAFAVLAVLAAIFAFLQRSAAIDSEAIAVAAQSTTAYEATRAEVNLNEAIAARATSDFNESQAEIERDNAVAALNDSSARLLLNLSEGYFESDPLLANRLLLEAIAVAGSVSVSEEAAVALADNMRTGQIVIPITRSVTSYIEVLSGTVYVVNFPVGNDDLISGQTGSHITRLSGSVERTYSIPNNPFFVVDYSNAQDELRQTDGVQVIPLNGPVSAVTPIPDSTFYAVEYTDEQVELRRTDDAEWMVEVSEVEPWPDSPIYEIAHNGGQNELRRTDDDDWVIGNFLFAYLVRGTPFYVIRYADAQTELRLISDDEWVVTFSESVSNIFPLPDSPFYIVDFTDASGELRRMDDREWSVVLPGRLSGSEPTPIPGSPFFVINYVDAPDELRRTDDIQWTLPFTESISSIRPLPGSPFYVVHYQFGRSELRRTDDQEWVENVSGAQSFPPFFEVLYSDRSNELRWTEDLEWVRSVAKSVDRVWPIPQSPFLVIDHDFTSGQLHRTDDTNWIDLPDEVDRVESIPNSPFFVVTYEDTPTELRRVATGTVVTDQDGHRLAEHANVLSNNREYYWILYQDGTSEIFSGERALVDLGLDVEQSLYFPKTNRVAVRYGDGQVNYIDLDLIEALGGADAAETLAAMSPEELIAFTCETLFTDNPEWDEAKLDEYLAFLPEGRARACGE